jgi:large subunit ribosomal protein L15e
MHKEISGLWRKPRESLGDVWKTRLVSWRREPTVTRIERPTRLDRAHSLGYKAKHGFVLARVKVRKGGRKTPKPSGGRTPKAAGRFFSLGKSLQVVAEEKAARKFPNCEIMNSYWAGEDGERKWFEIILVDVSHPSVKADRERCWITEKQHRGRGQRAKTSAGRKSRGLLKKGKGAEKLRPSIKAKKGRGK